MVSSRLGATALGVIFFLNSGCGPRYGLRVPNSLDEKLPYESRIELLEAENDLAAAVDRRDETENEIYRNRDALRRARDRLRDAEREADDAKEPASREVAVLARSEAEGRLAYLRSTQQVNADKRDLSELQLRCAFARYESTRLQIARKAKVSGAMEVGPEPFARQVKECEEDVGRTRLAMKVRLKQAEDAKLKWDEQKNALAKKTFDARASPYVE